MLPGMILMAAKSPNRVTGSYTDGASSTGASTVHTFSNRSIGAVPGAGETRTIIVCVGIVSTGTIGSVTLGGNAMTLIDSVVTHSNQVWTGFYQLSVPSGTTATVVVNAGISTAGIAIYRLIGANTTPYASSTDTADPIAMSLSTPPYGYAIASTQNRNRGAATWSGGVTENYDADAGSTDFFSSASAITDGATLSIGVASTGGNEIVGLSKSFMPA